MSVNRLLVSSDALRGRLAFRGFLGLPAEELALLYASIEVFTVDPQIAAADPTLTQLTACTVIHHNRCWLTYETGSGGRSMRIGRAIESNEPFLFLDDGLQAVALRQADEQADLSRRSDVRLAGLLRTEAEAQVRQLGLVYVARLRQPGIETRGIVSLRFCGEEDLRQSRAEFEPWSRVLIDSLHAL